MASKLPSILSQQLINNAIGMNSPVRQRKSQVIAWRTILFSHEFLGLNAG